MVTAGPLKVWQGVYPFLQLHCSHRASINYFTYLENKLFSLVKFFSVREESAFCIVICWHLLVQPPKYQINALQKPQLQQSNRSVGVGSFFGSGVYTTILSVREGSVFELWFVDIGWSTRISDWCALQKPQIWSNQTEVWGLNHFFIRGFHQSGAQWHFDQQLHMVPVQSDFWIKEMNTWCTFTNSMSFGTSVLRSCRRSDKLSSLN